MKNTIILLTLFFSLQFFAQQRHGDRIKTLKVGFITEKLDLTPEQAQKFWPIYNDFERKIGAIRFKELREYRKQIRQNLDHMTEAEANTLIKKMTNAEGKMHELHSNLSHQLLGVIPAKKIILLKLAETDFKKKMLQELRKSRKGN